MSTASRTSQLAGAVVTYVMSSLGGIAIVKFINYHYCLTPWLLFALLSRSTWLLSWPLHQGLQWRDKIFLGVSRKQLGIYLGIAIVLSIVELLNSLSMSTLPGSLYALFKGADIGFSMILSNWVLGKVYPIGQVVGALFVMGGVAMVWLFDSANNGHEDGQQNRILPGFSASITKGEISTPLASTLCILAAFLNALCSVVTEGTLKGRIKEEQAKYIQTTSITTYGEVFVGSGPSKLLVSNAFSMWTSFFSWSLLLAPCLLSGQLLGVFKNLGQGSTNGDCQATYIANESRDLVQIIGLLCASWCISVLRKAFKALDLCR